MKKNCLLILFAANFLLAMHHEPEVEFTVPSLVNLSVKAVAAEVVRSGTDLKEINLPIDLMRIVAKKYFQKKYENKVKSLFLKRIVAEQGACYCMPILSEDGKYLAFMNQNSHVICYNFSNGEKKIFINGNIIRIYHLFFDRQNNLYVSDENRIYDLDHNESYDFSGIFISLNYENFYAVREISQFVINNKSFCLYDKTSRFLLSGSLNDSERKYLFLQKHLPHTIRMSWDKRFENTALIQQKVFSKQENNKVRCFSSKQQTSQLSESFHAIEINKSDNLICLDDKGIITELDKNNKKIMKRIDSFTPYGRIDWPWDTQFYLKEFSDGLLCALVDSTQGRVIFKYADGLHYYSLPADCNHIQISADLLLVIHKKTSAEENCTNFYSTEPFKFSIYRLPGPLNETEKIEKFVKKWEDQLTKKSKN